MNETRIHIKIVRWLRKRGVFFAHVPNEGRAPNLKVAMGLLKGMPDLMIFDRPNTGEVGLAIEIKTKTGRVRPSQRKVLGKLKDRGWRVMVTRSYAACVVELESLGY
jgi:hypothetical protein